MTGCDGCVLGVAQRGQVDVDAADVLVAIEPQRTAEAAAGCDGAEVRLHEVRLVVPRKVDSLPAGGPEAPDERLDAAAGAGEQPGGSGCELRPRGVAQQVVERRLVRVGDVEVARPRPRPDGEEASGDREEPRAHAQNPA